MAAEATGQIPISRHAPRQDPPPSPPSPARVPLHVVSAETEFTDTTPPINPADIPALFLAATSVLRLINAGTSDGRRFSAAPQAKDRAAWRLVQTAVPSLTDKAAQEVINSWLHCKVLETRSYRDPIDRRNYPGLFVILLEEPAEVLLIHFRTLYDLTRHPRVLLLLHAISASIPYASTLRSLLVHRLLEIRRIITVRATTSGCGSAPFLGHRPRHS